MPAPDADPAGGPAHSPGRGRLPLDHRLLAFLGIVVPVAVVAGIAIGSGGGSRAPVPSDSRAEQAALQRFEADLEPLIDEGAFLVAVGMRPGVTDIAEGAFADDVLVDMAEGWLRSAQRLRADFANVETPDFLTDFAKLFDLSLARYVDTAEALLAAARATGDERAKLIERVPPLGDEADELYDRAQAELQRIRERLGIESEG